MDKKRIVASLLRNSDLSKRQIECLKKYLEKDDEAQIEAEIDLLPPPQAHLIKTYQRRLELGQKKQQSLEFLHNLERIIVSLRKNSDARFYIMVIDCGHYTDLYYFVEVNGQLEYIAVLWGPRVPAYARERPN